MWEVIGLVLGSIFGITICGVLYKIVTANNKNKTSKAQQSQTQSSKAHLGGAQTVPNSNAASGLQSGQRFTSPVGVSSVGYRVWPSSGYVHGMSRSARVFDVVDYKPDVEIVERDGSSELITLDGNQFLQRNQRTNRTIYHSDLCLTVALRSSAKIT